MSPERMTTNTSFKYRFASPNQQQTNYFELMMEKNLTRLGIKQDMIADTRPFVCLPGTLYPEQGAFSAVHPCGGSFGVRIVLKDGADAWLYGRISYDMNVKHDHGDGKPHWNFDIQGVTPGGESLDPYRDMSWHELPDSECVDISVVDVFGEEKLYRVKKT